MPIGVLTDSLMVALGGLLGKRIPDELKDNLNQVFGFPANSVVSETV